MTGARTHVCRQNYRQVEECADTWYKPRIQSTETVDLYTRQLANTPV